MTIDKPACTIEIEPAIALIDVPRRIRLVGWTPWHAVTVTARLRQADGSSWCSDAVFIADDRGEVDLSQVEPVSGKYRGIAPMGMIWSMVRDDDPTPTASGAEPASSVDPIVVRVQAHGSDGRSAQALLEQHFQASGVTRREVHEDGLVGALYTPAGGGPHPAIIVLSGSGGGLIETRAALWASHGVAALALGYFGAPGLPAHINDTPLEYFATALDWLRRRLRPRGDFVAVAGQSRGGELALLLGATFPERVSAVVAYVPSAVTNGALSARAPGTDRDAPSWTLGGKPLPIFGAGNRAMDWDLVDKAPSPRRQTPAFIAGLADRAAVERAAIKVERIKAPVILISGSDDGLWPSTPFAEMVERRLRACGHPYPVEHVRCEDAGHSILFPYVPTTTADKPHPVSKIVLIDGGTTEGRARANERSWQRVRAFIEAAVAARG